MSKAQTLVLFLFFIFSIDDKDGTHLNGFNTSMSESSEHNMCYCTEPLVGGFIAMALYSCTYYAQGLHSLKY